MCEHRTEIASALSVKGDVLRTAVTGYRLGTVCKDAARFSVSACPVVVEVVFVVKGLCNRGVDILHAVSICKALYADISHYIAAAVIVRFYPFGRVSILFKCADKLIQFVYPPAGAAVDCPVRLIAAEAVGLYLEYPCVLPDSDITVFKVLIEVKAQVTVRGGQTSVIRQQSTVFADICNKLGGFRLSCIVIRCYNASAVFLFIGHGRGTPGAAFQVEKKRRVAVVYAVLCAVHRNDEEQVFICSRRVIGALDRISFVAQLDQLLFAVNIILYGAFSRHLCSVQDRALHDLFHHCIYVGDAATVV